MGQRFPSKVVEKVDSEGKVVEEYPSMGKAAKANSLQHHEIRKACHGIIPIVGGFKFRFKEQAQ